jgi:hypothetical protein
MTGTPGSRTGRVRGLIVDDEPSLIDVLSAVAVVAVAERGRRSCPAAGGHSAPCLTRGGRRRCRALPRRLRVGRGQLQGAPRERPEPAHRPDFRPAPQERQGPGAGDTHRARAGPHHQADGGREMTTRPRLLRGPRTQSLRTRLLLFVGVTPVVVCAAMAFTTALIRRTYLMNDLDSRGTHAAERGLGGAGLDPGDKDDLSRSAPRRSPARAPRRSPSAPPSARPWRTSRRTARSTPGQSPASAPTGSPRSRATGCASWPAS